MVAQYADHPGLQADLIHDAASLVQFTAGQLARSGLPKKGEKRSDKFATGFDHLADRNHGGVVAGVFTLHSNCCLMILDTI
jgi:hypothetical protein